MRRARRLWLAGLVLGGLAAIAPGRAQENAAGADAEPRFRLRAEVKAHARHSRAVEFRSPFPFPPSFIPPGETAVFLRPPSEGDSLELSTVNLIGEANLDPNITGRIEVHVLDLYNRNPTSSDDRVQLREAWLRFGRKFEGQEQQPERATVYALFGKAPRFAKQRVRRLESYGLWSTAVGRFEEVQLELGGTLGRHAYWRAQLANGNPVFFRDPNALAGDNGTPERQPATATTAPQPIFESGFPILYDAKSTDLNRESEFQVGGGLGLRFVAADGDGVDVLGWYFRRDLADHVAMRGTSYGGDIELLLGPFPSLFHFSLPIAGREKREWGLNVDARAGALLLFAQYVDQEIAGLPRSGYEAEVAWRAEIAGLLVGETPVLRWIQPVIRVSSIDNDFVSHPFYPAPSVAWDWRKYDLGVRVGVVPGVDLTAEYARNDMQTEAGTRHPDELLFTVRAAY